MIYHLHSRRRLQIPLGYYVLSQSRRVDYQRNVGVAIVVTKKITAILCFTLIVGCGGRSANPVPDYRVGDEAMGCGEIRAEMAHVDSQVARLVPESKKTGKNVQAA